MSNNKISKKQVTEIVSKLKQTITHPSVSALIYGYLKEKDLNLKTMTVEQWKEIEKDLVEIILAETFPGEGVSEDQLNFTSLANSIGFMTTFIEKVNASISDANNIKEEPVTKTTSESRFEVV